MELKQNLSNNLKVLRATRKASLAEFAEEIGIGKTTLQDIENCRSSSTLDTVDHIAANLKIPSVVLLSSSNNPETFQNSILLLKSIEKFCTLSNERQIEMVRLFDRMVQLLTSDDI